MNKGVSRKRVWLDLGITVASALMVIASRFSSSPWLILLALILLAAELVAVVEQSRCPYCGRRGMRRGLPWEPKAGFCRKCGETIQWSD